MVEFDRTLIDLPRMVHYGKHDDPTLADAVHQALRFGAVLVYITPARKKMSEEILDAYSRMNDRFWLYEVNMGMDVVLRARARDYLQRFPRAYMYVR